MVLRSHGVLVRVIIPVQQTIHTVHEYLNTKIRGDNVTRTTINRVMFKQYI